MKQDYETLQKEYDKLFFKLKEANNYIGERNQEINRLMKAFSRMQDNLLEIIEKCDYNSISELLGALCRLYCESGHDFYFGNEEKRTL